MLPSAPSSLQRDPQSKMFAEGRSQTKIASPQNEENYSLRTLIASQHDRSANTRSSLSEDTYSHVTFGESRGTSCRLTSTHSTSVCMQSQLSGYSCKTTQTQTQTHTTHIHTLVNTIHGFKLQRLITEWLLGPQSEAIFIMEQLWKFKITIPV